MKILPRSRDFLKNPLILILFVACIGQSCYSVRISNKSGVPEPDPVNFESGFYRGKAVHVMDTTINKSLLNEFTVNVDCPSGCFHVMEYRVTLGAALLSGITFGKKQKIQVKYVCLKEEN